MDESTKVLTCRLCHYEISTQEFHIIDDVIKEVLTVVGLGLVDGSSNVVCTECFPKLFAAFDFKKMCLNTQDTICSYINCEGASDIDLRNIYMKEKGTDESTMNSKDKICRFCLELISNEYLPLEQIVDSKIMCRYIPEMKFNTEDLVICKQCSESLDVHTSFLNNCLYREEKFETHIKDVGSIKTEDIEFKFEEKNEIREPSEIQWKPLPALEKCQRSDNTELMEHESLQKKNQQKPADNYECDKCNYKTRFNCSLKKHQLVHKDPSELQIYRCDKCDFQTIHKYNLPLHQLKHKEISERRVYKCGQCEFKTVWKRCIIRHQTKHKDPLELEVYKCGICEFQTLHKNEIALHQLEHKNTSEKPVYECGKCDFKVICRKAMTRHLLEHEDPSKVQIYECEKCDYRTKRKENLQQHRITHKDASEVRIFTCNKCDFKTKHKRCVAEHQLKHKDPSEVQMYQCDKCDLKTKYKQSLLRHQAKHK